MGEDNHGLLLALATENTELRQQLSTAQDMLVETAIDAGGLHARIEALQVELAEMRGQRDTWRAEAMRLRGAAPLRA
jgi:septal ring factor EnvC (AmiA/AmiB activator)